MSGGSVNGRFRPTRTSSALDLELGIEWYATDCPGIGGRLRVEVEDFVVREVLTNGFVAGGNVELGEKVGDYLWLEVEKRLVDTFTAARMIARELGLSARRLSFGGLKDARSVSYQVISVEGAKGVSIIGREIGGRIKVLRAWRMDRPITPGEVYGNEFTIRVRGVRRLPEVVEKVLEAGTLAYYGYQRFGTVRPITHLVGKCLIRGDLEGAIRYLLCWRALLEGEEVLKAREYACRGEYGKALEAMPKKYFEERVLLKSLTREPRNYANALKKLPTSLVKLFVEAYQSYLFNKLLSERVEEGLPIERPVEGDLVALLDERGILTSHVVKVSGRIVERLDLRKFTLVLPVPGYSIKAPDGRMGEVLRRVLRAEEVTLEDFKIKWYPQVSLRGHYRSTTVKPENPSYEFQGDDLILRFRLKRGYYATVVVRELVKPADPLGQGF